MARSLLRSLAVGPGNRSPRGARGEATTFRAAEGHDDVVCRLI
ncbi:uncharacterized protein J3R85_014988 [Psidium guajava]|nr:uncharacterized protein J3R85_014988 [Psidium guajava]